MGPAARPAWRALRDRGLPLLVAVLLGALAWLTGLGGGLDSGFQEGRWRLLARPASGQFVFIEIDARSLARFRQWPWPRSTYVAALDRLNRAGVRNIAFDIDFSAPSTAAEDDALARAIAGSRAPVLLPTFRQASSQGDETVLENLPIPALRERTQLAAVNIFADEDGQVRSYPYGVTTGGLPRPSVGAMLAGATGRAGTGFPIDGAIDSASVPRISFADLVAGRFAPGVLQGRSVLIGASAIELGDRYPLPGRGVVPGPLIQLLAAETLLQQSAPFDHGPALPLLIAVGAVWLAATGSRLRRAALLGGGSVAVLALPLASEAARVGTFAIAPALIALAGGGLALAFHAALRAVRQARLSDGETGLPNGRAFGDLPGAGGQATAVVLRIANFADIASVLGRSAAAELMLRVAERLTHAGDSAIHRIDDGALAWLVIDGDPQAAIDRVEGAAALLMRPFELGSRQIDLAFGFGLAEAGGRDAATRAAKAADNAVARGVRWARYTADIGRESEWRLALAAELDQAMAAGDITVAYQPKLDIRGDTITGAEALVRWRHPERGMIPPDSFIPVLEESGRIADLTLYVLERALADRDGWAAAGLDLGVAVNLSALLPADAAFLPRLEAVLARHPAAVARLTLEVTESAAMTDPERAIAALDHLAGLGLALSIDDYGTGQSTLSYLKRLPAREIKIDKGFVLALESSRSDQAMVRSTIDLAHELGFKVVAEGVENAAVLEMLAAFGCDTAQGWHIGRPMPSADFAALAGTPRAGAGAGPAIDLARQFG